MLLLILNAEARETLESLNRTSRVDLRLTPAPLQKGDAGLNTDLLRDCATDQTWSHFGGFLASLPIEARSDFC
jgi:hypothetical protein